MRISLRAAAMVMVVLSAALAGAAPKGKLRQIAVVDLPGRPGFDDSLFANGMLLIAHHGSDSVDIFDPVKRRLTGRVEGVSDPRGMALDPQSGIVYIAAAGTNSIVALNSKSWKVDGVIGLKRTPDAVLLLPGLNSLLITNPGSNAVSLISTESLGRKEAELQNLDLQGRPNSLAWDAERHVAYVSVEDRKEIIVLDPSRPEQAIVRRISLEGASQPTDLVFDPSSRSLLVAVRFAVLQIDADGGKEVARVPAAAGVDRLWLDGSGSSLYAAADDGSLSIISLQGGKMTGSAEFYAGVRGKAVAADPVSKMVYLAGGKDGHSKMVILKPANVAAAATSEVETAQKQ